MENKRFEIAETAGSVKGFYVVVDKETGVNYLVAKFGAGAGICPLIDKDGKPIVTRQLPMEKGYAMQFEHWVLCPICQSKTRTKIRLDSVLENFPLFCPKCKKEFLVNIKRLEVTVINEPDAQTQSR